MAILLNASTKVLVQGITGNQGRYHANKMRDYGTKIVGGTSPGKGGSEVDGMPVFDTVAEAVEVTGATASVIYIPAPYAKEAALEAIDAGIKLLVIITEGIPKQDTMAMVYHARKNNVVMIGPNCPGLIAPGEAKIGIIPGNIVKKGDVGVVSRSGTLTYEAIEQDNKGGLGEANCIGIGGDPIKATNFVQVLKMYQDDPEIKRIVMIGEIGGAAEEEAAKFIKEYPVKKPVVGFIAGNTAREGVTMGHSGAIIQGDVGTAAGKVKALQAVGVKMADRISDIPKLLK